MKTHCNPLATTIKLAVVRLLSVTISTLALHAAVPLAWDARPGNPAPASFDRYHGETLEFRCTFRGFSPDGQTVFGQDADIRLWYQTNGMGSAWWSAPATIQSNVLTATWSPALDPGADRVSLFFGAPSNAYAAAVLRLRHSPGFAPGTMPDPETFHESDPVFSEWLSTYTPPDTSLEPATNYTDRALSSFAATGTVARALTYGTATRWTDATGCVWEASMSWKITPPTFPGADGYPEEYVGEPIYLYEDHSPGAWWSPRVGGDWLLGLGKGYSNSTELAWSVDVEAAIAITATRGLVTNLIGRIALTNDIPAASDLTPSTNYTAQSLASFAATGTVSRASSYGTPTRWTDATGCVWEVTLDGAPWMDGDKVLVYTNDEYGASWVWGGIDWLQYSFGTWSYECGHRTASFVAIAPEDTTVLVMHDISSDPPLADVTLVRPTLTNLVGRVAYTNDLPTTPSEVGAAPASLVQAVTNLQVESALVYRLYSGSNVVAEVTNYSSQVHAPSLRLMQLNESNEYVTVWTEANGLARTLKRANEYTDDATGEVARSAAPRAWSRTTSGLGAEAPSNTTWISTPTTVIAGGFEYAKFVDTYGEVWVLTSNGMAAEFNPDTNAYFRITADDGTPVFSIEKSDAQLVGANSAGITVGESSITIPVPVVSSTAPTMWWSESLSSGFWDNESSPPTGATVTWSGTAGSWVCTVSFTGTRPSSMFFKFNFRQEGGVVIRNNATTDLSSGIYVNGTKFVPTVSGNNLIWTKQ